MGFFSSLFGFNSEDEDSRTEAIIKDFNQAHYARVMNDDKKAQAEYEKSRQISDKFFRFLEAEKFDQALDFINSTLESIIDDSSLFEHKSMVLRLMKKYDEAIDVLEDALNRFPGDRFSLYRARAEILMETEKYSEAIICLSKAIESALTEEETDSFFLKYTYSERGEAYFKSGNYPLAMADFDKAIELDPEVSFFYSNRSDAHLAVKNYQAALNDIDKCINLEGLKPSSIRVWTRGKIYTEMGDYEKAINDYTTAITLTQKEEFGIGGHFDRGEIYLLTGNYSSALEDFSEEIKNNPDWSEAYQKRAEVYQRLGQNILAQADLEKAHLLEKEEFENQFDQSEV